ncbi:MAG: DUF4340 domain-containing protein [Deltaproteobacteria bacterium]|nr:DUF4340 domain-containing protein [Deltaproteobacteria bacterium]
MRLFKKTVFWVLMLAVLGGLFYLIDRKSEEKKAATEIQKRLFAFSPSDIMGFTITKKGAQPVSVKREGEVWLVTSPVNAPGDAKEVDEYLDKLVSAKLDGVLFEKAPEEKFKEMGLFDPDLSVELIPASGESRTIVFGDTGPTHNISFAAIKNEPRIIRINTDIKTDADKAAYDMRDKTILAFEPTRIRKLDIKWTDGNRVVVEQTSEGKWNTLGLPDGRTDFLRLMEVLVKFKKTGIKAFIDEDPLDLGLYGLKTPRVRLLFVDEKGVKHSTYIGGRDKERRGYYAVNGEAKNVFLLEEDIVDSIPRSIGDLEEKNEGTKG